MFPVPAAVRRHFDLEKTPYDEQFAERIAGRRKSFPDEKLFLDRLFDLIHVQSERYLTRWRRSADENRY